MKDETWRTTALLLLAGLAGTAQAQGCSPSNRLKATEIGALLNGNTICVGGGSGWEYQEQHRAPGGGAPASAAMTSGALLDYKRGPGHATDPAKVVGSWSISGNFGSSASVTHDYGSGGSYTYSVHGSGAVGSVHMLCGPTTVSALIKPGQGGC